MKVLGKKICVLEEKAKEREVNGIVIPVNKMDMHKPIHAKVIAVGPEVEGIREGDFVLYMPMSGQEVSSENGKTVKVMHVDEVLVVE